MRHQFCVSPNQSTPGSELRRRSDVWNGIAVLFISVTHRHAFCGDREMLITKLIIAFFNLKSLDTRQSELTCFLSKLFSFCDSFRSSLGNTEVWLFTLCHFFIMLTWKQGKSLNRLTTDGNYRYKLITWTALPLEKVLLCNRHRRLKVQCVIYWQNIDLYV